MSEVKRYIIGRNGLPSSMIPVNMLRRATTTPSPPSWPWLRTQQKREMLLASNAVAWKWRSRNFALN